MIHDHKNKNSSNETQEITEGNHPNDDEEVLKNSDETAGKNTDGADLEKTQKETDESNGAETIGIP
jgi:hypothetical protein